MRSLNEEEFSPYTVPVDEVLEVWKYFWHLTDELAEKKPMLQQLVEMMTEVKSSNNTIIGLLTAYHQNDKNWQ